MEIKLDELQKFSERIYWLPPDARTDRPVLGLVVGDNASLVVDAGASEAHAQLFLNQIAKLNVPPIQTVVLTHWHWDHVFGAAAYTCPLIAHTLTTQIIQQLAAWDWHDAALAQRVAQGLEIEFCREMLQKELPDRHDFKLRLPDTSFTQEMEIDLGDVRCLIKHVGGDHAADSCLVFVPEESFVFLSDCLYQNLYADPVNYTSRIVPLYQTVLDLEAAHFLFGHEMPVVNRERLLHEAAQLSVVSGLVKEFGDDTAVIQQTMQQNQPELVDEWLDELIIFPAEGLIQAAAPCGSSDDEARRYAS
jgi:glyoxylase-like metal-dependent hydrolase (beta-lactamase superfamily II)